MLTAQNGPGLGRFLFDGTKLFQYPGSVVPADVLHVVGDDFLCVGCPPGRCPCPRGFSIADHPMSFSRGPGQLATTTLFEADGSEFRVSMFHER